MIAGSSRWIRFARVRRVEGADLLKSGDLRHIENIINVDSLVGHRETGIMVDGEVAQGMSPGRYRTCQRQAQRCENRGPAHSPACQHNVCTLSVHGCLRYNSDTIAART